MSHPVPILKHCLQPRTNATEFFRDIVQPRVADMDFSIQTLKSLFLEQYAGTYWKATAHTRLFSIGYIEGESVKAFLDRFSAAAYQANLDLASTDVQLNFLKVTVLAKVPDSVKRLVGTKEADSFPTCAELMKELKLYNGIPDDGKGCCVIYCPKCLRAGGSFKCVNKQCLYNQGEVHQRTPQNLGGSGASGKKPEGRRTPMETPRTTSTKLCTLCNKTPWSHDHWMKCREENRDVLRKRKQENHDGGRKTPENRYGRVLELGSPEEKLITDDDLEDAYALSMANLSESFKSVSDVAMGFNGLYSINDQQQNCLIDTGASRSFMNPATAAKLGISVSKLTKPIHFGLALDQVQSEVDRTTVPVKIVSSNGKSTTRQFLVSEMQDEVVIGRDLFSALGIYIAGVSTKGVNTKEAYPFDPTDEVLTADEITAGLENYINKETNELVDMANKGDSQYFPIIAATMALRAQELFRDTLQVNEGLRGFCTHPSAVIHIDTGEAKPAFRRQYTIPQALHDIVRKQITEWLDEGFIKAHEEPTDYNNPLLVVPKRDIARAIVAWRVCIDPRLLNLAIRSVNYPLPLIDDLLFRLAGSIVFSKLDLRKGFHQFKVKLEDQLKTTFTWDGQQYCFIGAPFGFKHVPSIFQKVMAEILRGMEAFVIIYIKKKNSEALTVWPNQIHYLLSKHT